MIKRYYAYLQIKQNIRLGKRTNSKDHLERAKNMSLANNFVTPLTSLVVVVDTPDTPTTTTTTITTTTPFSWGTVTYPTVRHTYRANSPSRLRMKEQVYRFINNDSGRTNSPVRKPEIIEIDETTDVEDPDTCKITLYSEPLYTGESVTLKNDVTDLTEWDFVEKLVSVKVEGPCSWRIYQGEERTVTSS